MFLANRNNRKEALPITTVTNLLNIDNESFTQTTSTWNTNNRLYTKRWMILGSNTTLSITNVVNGQVGYLVVLQSGGGFHLTLPLNSLGNTFVDKRNGNVTLLKYVFDGSNFIWDSITAPIDTHVTATLFDQCFNATNPNFLMNYGYNGGSINDLNTANGITGIVQFATGTNPNGAYTRILTIANNLLMGNIAFTFRCIFRLNIALANGTDSYFNIIGFSDAFSTGLTTTDNTTNGVYLYYDLNSPNFRYITKSNSVTTNTNSGLAAAINTWYDLTITVNKAGTNANFIINNTNSVNVTTNLPVNRNTNILIGIIKTLGTTNRHFDVDYYSFTYDKS